MKNWENKMMVQKLELLVLGEGAGTASMTAWESGVSRGAANPIGVGKWSETYGITRGKSNPVW